MRRLYFLFFVQILTVSVGFAQNLVPNAGFEDNKGGYVTVARDEIANRRKFEATIEAWTSEIGRASCRERVLLMV